ncbi:hypothetical protein M431DRAFT_494051 [Trichoderma harzianum CBS 226.95]|uniref:Uncharacterized protein n=1 Tax=Trichoderma harzianum CBS 226.95 TaxID=983964 RepID=A0A2T4AF23_TRIHA|nr:hypothetical protein M431DRAFT_494051 [Trichoderma harzianum CBS 226.95]PTB55612.1 hypothetical protein M431DRAFT_494051 [Trichoderma harzianum CBS 226.95]
MPEQRPTASDSLDPMGFEKRCVTCFVERERRREGETTDLGGRSTGRTGGGWAKATREQRYEAAGANAGRCTPSGTGLGYEELQRRRGTGARTCSDIQQYCC